MQTRVPRMLADNSGRITGYPQGMQVADKSLALIGNASGQGAEVAGIAPRHFR